jgi:16S rRNA (guanine(966)-N(2))-methyltransferase RsmD
MMFEVSRGFHLFGLQMRIIAGTFKGARLFSPKSLQIRPTSDRVREYIFSCLGEDVVESTVLDLFAGTGAIGIEALSRGAAKVVFVDNSFDAINLVRKNLVKVKAAETVFRKSAETFLKTTENQFHLIFCDPPYLYDRFNLILQRIFARHLLADDGILIYESSSREAAPLEDGFQINRQKKMGDTLITFYKMDYENSNLPGNI